MHNKVLYLRVKPRTKRISKFFSIKQHSIPGVLLNHQNGTTLTIFFSLRSCDNELANQDMLTTITNREVIRMTQTKNTTMNVIPGINELNASLLEQVNREAEKEKEAKDTGLVHMFIGWIKDCF